MNLIDCFKNYSLPVFITDKDLNILFVNTEMEKFNVKKVTEAVIDRFKKYPDDFFILHLESLKIHIKAIVSTYDEYYLFTIENITNIEHILDKFFTLNSIINQATFGVIITDIEGKILFINYGFEKLTGYTFDEVYGKKPSLWKSGEHDEKFYKQLWDTILSGKEWKGNFINKKKNGDLYIDETVIFPIFDDEGEITEFCAIKQDVTNLKQMEKNLIQSERLVAMGRMIHNISHDMKNILTGIYALAYYLDQRVSDKEDKKITSQLLKYVNTLTNFTQSLKNLENEESYQVMEIDLCEFISDAVPFYRRLIGKAIQLEFECDFNCKVEMSSIHLEQLLLNLIVNARDAVKDKFGEEFGGLIKITTAVDNENVIISVSDNGKGIPEHILDKIFTLSFTTKDDGTGVGLPIIRNIVKKYDGEIFVDSKEGEGTTFRIAFPVKICKERLNIFVKD